MARKKKNKDIDAKLDGMAAVKEMEPADMPPAEIAAAAEIPPADEPEEKQEPEKKADSRLVRDGKEGAEFYARIVQMARNKRYTIVCPYLDGYSPGRMVLPKTGRERKVFEQTADGLKEKIIPGKFAKLGAKFWVRQVNGVEGLYELVK